MEVILIPIHAAGKDLAHIATLASVTDNSPHGSAIFSQSLDLAVQFSIPKGARLIPPSALGELSGVDFKTRKIRKGTCPEIQNWVQEFGRSVSERATEIVSEIESRGNRAMIIADQEQDLGVIELLGSYSGAHQRRQTDPVSAVQN
jgi:high-affinity K+ transport system ATPase subunit B